MKYFAIALLILIPVFACGPYFAPSILPGNRKFKVMLLAQFNEELASVKNKDHKNKALLEVDKRGNLEKEFSEALKYYKTPNKEKVLKEYLNIRKRIEEYRSKKLSDKLIKFPKILLSNNLPKEYYLYLDGAINYYEGLHSIAIKRWKELLALPKNERLYRTVWARYMIAESYILTDYEAYLKQNELLRQDIKNGFKDVQGLGIATFGNEGFHSKNAEDFNEAIKRYYYHFINGGKGAAESLKFTIYELFEKDEEKIISVAKDPLSREIVTRFLISSYSSSAHDKDRENWLLSLEKLKITDASLTDRFAWVAYRNGNFKLTKRYLDLTKDDSVIKHWLSSRLAFREGKDDTAMKHLLQVALILKKDPKGFFLYDNDFYYHNSSYEDLQKFNLGEIALIHLDKGQLQQSLKFFFMSEYWTDAAYLAERLLNIDEMKAFIAENEKHLKSKKELYPMLRHLLARKMTRNGRWKEALPYFPKDMVGEVKTLFSNITKGQDPTFSQKERADFLWKASCITRDSGMSLLGTELFPDSRTLGGLFEEPAMGDWRIKLNSKSEIKMSNLEKERLKTPPSKPVKRYHYRYIAAELAWKAIKLMPGNNDETAKRLIIAGSWLKAKDPKAADRFYKELVNKCGKTELGKKADKLRWFPKLTEE